LDRWNHAILRRLDLEVREARELFFASHTALEENDRLYRPLPGNGIRDVPSARGILAYSEPSTTDGILNVCAWTSMESTVGATAITRARKRFFSKELPGAEERDDSFLPSWRGYGEFCATHPVIEDSTSRISLRKEDPLGQQVDKFSSRSCLFKKRGEVKSRASHLRHLNGLSQMRSSREQLGTI